MEGIEVQTKVVSLFVVMLDVFFNSRIVRPRTLEFIDYHLFILEPLGAIFLERNIVHVYPDGFPLVIISMNPGNWLYELPYRPFILNMVTDKGCASPLGT